MTESEARQSPAQADDDEALRRRLLKRVGVAAVVVAGLLAGLALFDGQDGGGEKRATPIARVEPPVKPIERAGEKAVAEPAVTEKAEEEETAESSAASTAPAEFAAAPEHSEAPKLRGRSDERPLTAPAKFQSAALRPSEPVIPAARPEPAREVARAPVREAAKPATAARPIAQAIESRNFLLQMGVFNNLANAEELKSRLDAAGVPAHIEARVQVGPFATRQEAEQAREKLKSLGMDPGLLVAAHK